MCGVPGHARHAPDRIEDRACDVPRLRRDADGAVSHSTGHPGSQLLDARWQDPFGDAKQERHPGRLTVITQNVDGLHQRAGSTGVLALHGNIAEDKWLDAPRSCCSVDAAQPGQPPSCPRCGNMLRPAVVWFGEGLAADVVRRAFEAARACEVALVVGTSSIVYPAAALPETARSHGAFVIEVNPEATPLTPLASVSLRGPASAIVPALVEAGA